MHGRLSATARLTWKGKPGDLLPAECVPVVVQLSGKPEKADTLRHADLVASLPSGRHQAGPIVAVQLLADCYASGMVEGPGLCPVQVQAKSMAPVVVGLPAGASLRLHTAKPGRCLVWPLVLKQ